MKQRDRKHFLYLPVLYLPVGIWRGLFLEGGVNGHVAEALPGDGLCCLWPALCRPHLRELSSRRRREVRREEEDRRTGHLSAPALN